ncbi:MAG TPA: hypothetical protein PK729_14405, partial [Candidatus Hydrogenedentes bacterium]|nr:hypothetical protein [Candidatus Hydrogenedentota bacterium]
PYPKRASFLSNFGDTILKYFLDSADPDFEDTIPKIVCIGPAAESILSRDNFSIVSPKFDI